MRGLLIQDWLTIRGGGNTPTITQGADAWVDVGDVEDLVLFADVREVSGSSPKIGYQTSPTKLETNFVYMFPPTAIATGVTLTRIFASYSAVPVARYVRWQLTNMIACDVTFRIWAATYAWVKAVPA